MLPRFFGALVIIVFFLTLFSPVAFADYLADITVSQETPASVPLNWIIEVACDGQWSGGGFDDEVKIIAKPMTNGSLSPGAYFVDAGPFDAGNGKCWPTFTIQSGETVVDEVVLTMEVGPGKYGTLLEMHIPVWLHFGPHVIRNIIIDPDWPERMQFGQRVNIDFIWETNHVGGHRIVVRPLTNGSYTPGQGTSGSGIYTGTSGYGAAWFTIISGEADIDEIVFEMYNDDWTELLMEFRIPADYHYGSTAIQNIVLSPGTPSSMIHSGYVTINYDYVTDHPMDVKIYAIPQTDGSNSPGHVVSPVVPLPPMSGSGENDFTITASGGLIDVDEILFGMRDFFDHQILIDEFRLPVNYHFSEHAVLQAELTPKAPAILSHDVFVNVEIICRNGSTEAGWLYTHPMSNGAETPNLSAFNRTAVDPGVNLPITQSFRITEGDYSIDQLRFQLFNGRENELWLSFFMDTELHYGNVASLSPVIDLPMASMPVLHPNYPNPFNPRTTIKFDLPADMVAGVKVYDLCGRLVKTLVRRQAMTAGEKQAYWNGRDDFGRTVAAGVYLYRLEGGTFSVAKMMTLVK